MKVVKENDKIVVTNMDERLAIHVINTLSRDFEVVLPCMVNGFEFDMLPEGLIVSLEDAGEGVEVGSNIGDNGVFRTLAYTLLDNRGKSTDITVEEGLKFLETVFDEVVKNAE